MTGLLPNEQARLIAASRLPTIAMAYDNDDGSLCFIGGITEVAKGTGELWVIWKTPSHDSWESVKQLYYFLRDAGNFKRIQVYIFDTEECQKSLRMITKFGLSYECTLKSFIDGFDAKLYAWVRG